MLAVSDRRLRAAVTPRDDAEHVSVEAAIGDVRVAALDVPAWSVFPRVALGAHAGILTLDEQIAPGGAAPIGLLGGGQLILRTSREASVEAEVEAGTTAGGRLVYGARGRAAFRAGARAFHPVFSFGAGIIGSGGPEGTLRGIAAVGLGFEHALDARLDLRVEAIVGARGGLGGVGAVAGLLVGTSVPL